MTARSPHRTLALCACALPALLLACHSPGVQRAHPAPSSGRVITAEDIQRTGATNAWDALKECGAPVSLRERWDGEPAGLQSKRGRSSMVIRSSDTPVVLLDGARLNDFRSLKQIAAHSIFEIRILSGIEGTVREGTNAGGGVIIIQTMARRD